MSQPADLSPEVHTAAGVVRGRWQNAVAVFRGIPYAEPPVGSHRFKAPVPARQWNGTRDALDFGPPVPQATHAGSVMTSEFGSAADGSADCLTLNVWSSDLGATRMPVMVWIHGGAYLEGTSSNPHHDGEILAKAGVVMVSMNYRTGVEGFAHIVGAPDNRGILDQVAALRWVQDNIAAFGGDPGNVTVFGQSAGAGSVAALLAMPLAAGLFRRAIAQSVPGTYFSPRLAGAITSAITAELGARATINEMAPIPPRALLDATETLLRRMPEFLDSWGPMALSPTPFSPVVDGDLLPHAPWRALAGGAARGIDLLVGHTRDEYRLFAAHLGDEVTDDRVTTILKHLAPSPEEYGAAYPDAIPAQLYELVNADWLFRMPSLHLANAQRAGRGVRGPTNCAGATTASRTPRTASIFCSYSEHSAPTTCATIPPPIRTPQPRPSASPATCAPTGCTSRRRAIPVGHPMIRTRDPLVSTTPSRPPSPIPRRNRAASGPPTSSTLWT